MKKVVFLSILAVTIFSFITCATSSNAAKKTTLDSTIQQAAENMGVNLRSGIKIAMLNFTSRSNAFSEYVLDELGGALVNTKRVSVIDRRELDLIRKEENFQLSGEVSDESMVSIGKKLGAQMIVSGSLRYMGGEYRFMARTLNVETAQVEAFYSSDIPRKDKKTTYLLSVRNPPPPPPPKPQAVTQPTAEDPYKPLKGIQNATVIGTVSTRFEFYGPPYNSNIISINEKAYFSLLETAKKEYTGSIDIADITWSHNGSYSGMNYTATGKVVRLN